MGGSQLSVYKDVLVLQAFFLGSIVRNKSITSHKKVRQCSLDPILKNNMVIIHFQTKFLEYLTGFNSVDTGQGKSACMGFGCLQLHVPNL